MPTHLILERRAYTDNAELLQTTTIKEHTSYDLLRSTRYKLILSAHLNLSLLNIPSFLASRFLSL